MQTHDRHVWRGRLPAGLSVVAVSASLLSCTSHGGAATPPARVQKIFKSIVADGLHFNGRLTLSWTHTTVARWASVTHEGYPPTTDLSTSMLVVEVDSDRTMTCDGCFTSSIGTRTPSGHFVIRTSRMGAAGGRETSMGPHPSFRLAQLGPVQSTVV
jgi:hypothetical protein